MTRRFIASLAEFFPEITIVVIGCAFVSVNLSGLLRSDAGAAAEVEKSAAAGAGLQPSLNEPIDIAAITALHLFGKREAAQAVDTSKLPSTTLNVKLVGVIGSTNPDNSRALIAADGKPAKAYFKGDALSDGSAILDIDSRFVIIQRGEQLEKLALHASVIAQTSVAPSRNAPLAAVTERSGVSPSPPAPAPRSAYQQISERLQAIRQKKDH